MHISQPFYQQQHSFAPWHNTQISFHQSNASRLLLLRNLPHPLQEHKELPTLVYLQTCNIYKVRLITLSSRFLIHGESKRERERPAKEVMCIAICLGHVPELPYGKFVRHCTSVFAEHVLKICRDKSTNNLITIFYIWVYVAILVHQKVLFRMKHQGRGTII